MADMIAMLDGLGAYGENPIGTVDPRLLPSRSTAAPDEETWRTKGVVSYPPKPYTLNAAEDTIDRGGMGLMPKVLIGAGAALVLYGLFKPKSPPPPMNGYPEPEMVSLEGAKKRRRRKKK